MTELKACVSWQKEYLTRSVNSRGEASWAQVQGWSKSRFSRGWAQCEERVALEGRNSLAR